MLLYVSTAKLLSMNLHDYTSYKVAFFLNKYCEGHNQKLPTAFGGNVIYLLS